MTIAQRCFTVGVIGVAAAHPVAAADPVDYAKARLERRLQAVRATGSITLDGVLDEPDWDRAPIARQFIQSEPAEGEPASEETEVRVLYDDRSLYLGVFARDRNAAGIIVNELRKDFRTESGDSFEVVLDTFRDERNGYMFGVNPMGAKWDAQMASEGRETNTNWDGVWQVRTRIGDDGWYAEIEIPFRTLKFADAGSQTWGINFLRRIRRRNEDTYWAPLPRIYRLARVSLAGTLEDLRGLEPGLNLRVKPYVLGNVSTVGAGDAAYDRDVGLDVKLAVTTGLTWDFTVNTDFSQVEADEQQINLTRFSLFFPEKRDFFLENSGIFQFGPGARMPGGGGGGGGGAAGGGGRQNALRNDFILFFSRQVGLSAAGRAIPILGGTRLTGRSGAYTLGALNIQQHAQGDSPATNFTAVRFRRDVLANSDVGVMLLNKDASGAAYNRVVGADANFRFFRNLEIGGFAARTFSPSEVVGTRGQDTAANVTAFWRDNVLELRGAFTTIGERFNDELGFVPRTGISKADFFAGARWRPRATSGWLRDLFPHWEFVNFERAGGGTESRYVDWHLPLTLQDGTFIEAGVNPTFEDIARPFTINSRRGIAIQPGRYEFDEYFVLFRTNSAARLGFNGRYSIGDFYDGYRRGYSLGVTTRLNEQLALAASVGLNDIDLPAGAFTTNLITGRIDYGFSTRMFLNALLQYNSDARQWSSNLRFNVIHRPLSDVFFVYNERRDSRSGDLIDRAIVAKMTYMVAF